MPENVQPFEAEVGRILDLVINSLYKERDIFLRELVSNASDACDKLRYESLSQPELLEGESAFAIRVRSDEDHGLLEIADNGIGMDRDDLVDNLGTIARSGTSRFLEAVTGDRKADLKLIGQFGVGFYSVFMVADKVIVRSRKAGDKQGWLWVSDGKTGYSISEAEDALPRGTSITLHLKEDAKEFLADRRIRDIIRRYSDHIGFPITLETVAGKDSEAEGKKDGDPEQINDGSALWARNRSDITEEQYREFYHHNAHAFDDPFVRVHFSAEGTLAYTALLFMPTQKPFDLYDPKRHHGVKLYVRRVFIGDDVEALLPRYLRFVSGVVDSEDLQLNVSRETLQHGSVVARMRKVLVKRLLDELARKAKADATAAGTGGEGEAAEDMSGEQEAATYTMFWESFGAVLKEGLYEDRENRGRLMELARFRTTRDDGWTSLAGYVERMKPGQEAIYYISGENIAGLRNSPQLEQARARGVEVLLLDDPVDEFWLPEVDEHDGRKFTSLTKGDVDLSSIDGGSQKDEEQPVEGLDKLIATIKLALGDAVKDVKLSKRLTDSAVCLVADAGSMDMRLERFLKQHNQLAQLGGRILEVNGGHALVRRMAALVDDAGRENELRELSQLLLDQARIIEGEPVPDPGAFSRRMSRYLAQAVAG
ncbi:MAG: molecular chaperone HtpG [Geminicoccaceae bacterium]|nr:molecular chaperone HtpG [Geminicoccaceae bacterium]